MVGIFCLIGLVVVIGLRSTSTLGLAFDIVGVAILFFSALPNKAIRMTAVTELFHKQIAGSTIDIAFCGISSLSWLTLYPDDRYRNTSFSIAIVGYVAGRCRCQSVIVSVRHGAGHQAGQRDDEM